MKKNGFTLIELLVVVAIIGVLAAVGTVAYTGYTKNAKSIAVQENFNLIAEGSELLLFNCDLNGFITTQYKKNGVTRVSKCIAENTNSIAHLLKSHYHHLGFKNPLTNYSLTQWEGTPVGAALKNFDGYVLFQGQPTSKCVIEISTTVPSPSTGKKEKFIHIISMHGRVNGCP